ncbi:MAG: regulatory protein [Actinomycetota bacterium]|nr:regulatory protein [Actinomycetota bacterium]
MSSAPEVDPAEVARTLVLRSLNAAPRTRAQLADLLASRGVPEDVARACLDRFEDLQLIDDAEYARMWVRSRHQLRGLPRRTLRYELMRKGVPSEAIEAALEIVDDEGEFEAATALARRKVSSLSAHPVQVQHRRAMAALVRRGFSSEVAARALRAVEVEPVEDY